MPVKSLRDLIKLAKSRPDDLAYASAGTGSGTFFCAEYFKGMAGVKMLHVAYKGGGPALAAILSGETSVYFTPIATGTPHIR
ncbi:MAG: LacI family transcriptional regulator, partial [Burkholderiales bacterium]|nr:LacI family transcriptional regulator [Burkholderiales bacterium]